jgi:hypothetical protein
MLHQHVIKSSGRPGRFITSIADEYPARQELIQSRPLPKPIGFPPTIARPGDRRNPAFRSQCEAEPRVLSPDTHRPGRPQTLTWSATPGRFLRSTSIADEYRGSTRLGPQNFLAPATVLSTRFGDREPRAQKNSGARVRAGTRAAVKFRRYFLAGTHAAKYWPCGYACRELVPPSGKVLAEVTLIASGKIARCDAYAGPGV